jgi:hypothetical protein
MRRSMVVFALGLLLVADIASAETLEVQLPQLVGLYSKDGTLGRSASFQLGKIPTTVLQVEVRISGTVNLGQYQCDFGTGPGEAPYPYNGIIFSMQMPDTVADYWWFGGAISGNGGQFEHTIVFNALTGHPVTWDFLKAGYGEIQFGAGPYNPWVECSAVVWPEATVKEAVLIVEGDFVVGVEKSTWGNIKALF